MNPQELHPFSGGRTPLIRFTQRNSSSCNSESILILFQSVSAVSYKLKLLDTARIHPVFHSSQLKKAIGNYTAEANLPEGFEVELQELEEPEEVLASTQGLC